MLIHHAHPETGVYLGSSQAEPDPLELELARKAVYEPAASAAVLAFQNATAALDDTPKSDAVRQRQQTILQTALAAATAAAERVAANQWLIPAHAYADAPPPTGDGEQAVRRNGSWVVEPFPVPIEAPVTDDQRAAAARARRDAEIKRLRWMVERHTDQVALGVAPDLSSAEFIALLQHVQALRDVPSQSGFPAAITWPEPPAFITTQEPVSQ
jgi:hypothetical protein